VHCDPPCIATPGRIASCDASRPAARRDLRCIAVVVASRPALRSDKKRSASRAWRLRCIATAHRFALGKGRAAVRRVVGPQTPLPNGSRFYCVGTTLTQRSVSHKLSRDCSKRLLGSGTQSLGTSAPVRAPNPRIPGASSSSRRQATPGDGTQTLPAPPTSLQESGGGDRADERSLRLRDQMTRCPTTRNSAARPDS
jgi:hypothetical protein